MRLRAVLAGCGAMSRGWLEAVAKTPGLSERIEVVGLVDVDEAAARTLAADQALTGAATGTSLDAMLADTRPDILFDVVPPAARRSVVETGLGHGCHVLSEKPMAVSLDDARALVAAARASRRLHAIVQNRRFNAGVRRIRAAIQGGLIGDLNAIHSDFFVGAHFGGFRDAMEHPLLLDMAIHTFDAARFMAGKDVRAVYCVEANPASSWYAHGSVANAIFEFADGVVVTYRGSWSAEGANTSWDADWRFIGSKGTILWDGAEALTAHVVDGDEGFFRPLRQVDVPPPPDGSLTHGHASVIGTFLAAIESGEAPETSGADNIKSLAMVFAAVESARLGQRVVLNT